MEQPCSTFDRRGTSSPNQGWISKVVGGSLLAYLRGFHEVVLVHVAFSSQLQLMSCMNGTPLPKYPMTEMGMPVEVQGTLRGSWNFCLPSISPETPRRSSVMLELWLCTRQLMEGAYTTLQGNGEYDEG